MDKIKRLKEVTEQLNHYRDSYYNNSESLISDKQYDDLFDELQSLEEETGIKCVLQDERNTTKDSHEFLINNFDMSRKKRKKIIDQQAAVRILQYWLDANRNKQ